MTPEKDTSLASVEEIWITVYEIQPDYFAHVVALDEKRAKFEHGKKELTYRNVKTYKFGKIEAYSDKA